MTSADAPELQLSDAHATPDVVLAESPPSGAVPSADAPPVSTPQYPKGDKPARCANGHALGTYSLPSSPPPAGTKCGECGTEFDPTRKRAPRRLLKQAGAIVPAKPPPPPEPPPPPGAIERLKTWAADYLAADKVSKRIAENGPPLRGLIVDPFVRSPMEDKLRARGVDPAAIRIHTGYEDDPQIILATELWARSLSNTVAAFVPSGSGAGNPIIAEVMLLVIASVAIKGALKNPDRPVDVKMTVARPKAPPKVAP